MMEVVGALARPARASGADTAPQARQRAAGLATDPTVRVQRRSGEQIGYTHLLRP